MNKNKDNIKQSIPLSVDMAIVEECKRGDAKLLYQFLEDNKHSLCRKYIGIDWYTDDIFCEASVKIFKGIESGKYNPDFRLSTWMSAVIKNCNTDWRRKLKSEKLNFDYVRIDYNFRSKDFTVLEIDDDSNNMLESLMDSEMSVYLKELVSKLKDSERQVVELRYYQGMSYEGISESAGLSMSQVKSQLHRAKISMRKIIKKQIR